MSFKNLRLSDEGVGVLVDEQPNAHLKVFADAVLFRPRIGQVFAATVNNVSATHVGLLLAEAFNITIPEDRLSSAFSFDVESNVW